MRRKRPRTNMGKTNKDYRNHKYPYRANIPNPLELMLLYVTGVKRTRITLPT